ncbi:thioredoxin-like protein [Gorgonomyces haynaldii]|nr:thioredoxin-like protein [Gorgonomyces haynaldii]KAI8913409.1 thioredoxin-like protein [Gorgonomyces haynaldii]
MREERMAQLKFEMEQRRLEETMRYGTYDLLTKEKDLMNAVTKTEKAVVHFGHKDFKRCHIMDKHLENLARKHHQTRFMKIDVANCPFLVEKMKIKVLPAIFMYLNGLAVDSFVGFEGIADKDDFSTQMLETRIAQSQVIRLQKEKVNIYRFANNDEDSD